MAESSNKFIALDKPIKKYIQEQQNKKTRAKPRATRTFKKTNMPRALSTMSFTKQEKCLEARSKRLTKKGQSKQTKHS